MEVTAALNPRPRPLPPRPLRNGRSPGAAVHRLPIGQKVDYRVSDDPAPVRDVNPAGAFKKLELEKRVEKERNG